MEEIRCDFNNVENLASLTKKLDAKFDVNEARSQGLFFQCYTDGSCDNLRDPHIGGSAYVILYNGNVFKEMSASFLHTTSNRMELLAIISAVNNCPIGSYVEIISDSKYAINMLSLKTGHSCNGDLFDQFVKCSAHLAGIKFTWIKGHSGNAYNERADQLAFGAYVTKCKTLGIHVETRYH